MVHYHCYYSSLQQKRNKNIKILYVVHPLAKELKNIDMIEDLPLTFYNLRVFRNLLPKVAGIAVMLPAVWHFLSYLLPCFRLFQPWTNLLRNWQILAVTHPRASWHFSTYYHDLSGCFNGGLTCCVTGRSWQ
jgi:hypothetical protein